jgi:hypothetical protein
MKSILMAMACAWLVGCNTTTPVGPAKSAQAILADNPLTVPSKMALIAITHPGAALRTVLKHPSVVALARSAAVADVLRAFGVPPGEGLAILGRYQRQVEQWKYWPVSVTAMVHLPELAKLLIPGGSIPQLHVQLVMRSADDAEAMRDHLEAALKEPGDDPVATVIAWHRDALTLRVEGAVVHLYSQALPLPTLHPAKGSSRIFVGAEQPPPVLAQYLPATHRAGVALDLVLQGDRIQGHWTSGAPAHPAIAADSILRSHVPPDAVEADWADASVWDDLGWGPAQLSDAIRERVAAGIKDGRLGAVLTVARHDDAPVVVKGQSTAGDWIELPGISLPVAWVIESKDAEGAADLLVEAFADLARSVGLTTVRFTQADGPRHLDLNALAAPFAKALRVDGDLRVTLTPQPGALFVSLQTAWGERVRQTHPITHTTVAHRFGRAQANSLHLLDQRLGALAQRVGRFTNTLSATTTSAGTLLPVVLDAIEWESSGVSGRLRVRFKTGFAPKVPLKPYVAPTMAFDWLPRFCDYEPLTRPSVPRNALVAVPDARVDRARFDGLVIIADSAGFQSRWHPQPLPADASIAAIVAWMRGPWAGRSGRSVLGLMLHPDISGAQLGRVLQAARQAGFGQVGMLFDHGRPELPSPDPARSTALRERIDAQSDPAAKQQILAGAFTGVINRCVGLSKAFSAQGDPSLAPSERCALMSTGAIESLLHCDRDVQVQYGAVLRTLMPTFVAQPAVFQLVDQGGQQLDAQASWGVQGPTLLRHANRRLTVPLKR